MSTARSRKIRSDVAAVIAHLDLDAFFAAVEVLEHPDYAGRPLVVGGDPDSRGVVATASYEARAFGIRSAMSAAEAYRRCPAAVFVRPDHGLYARYSRRVWQLVAARVALAEQVGIDEGYLDLTDAVATAREARAFLAGLQKAIVAETGLWCSLGCGTSKVVAKIASDHRKPRGVTVVPAGHEAAFLAPLAIRALPGIGPKAEERLRAAGVETIGDLAALDGDLLARLLPGVAGIELRDRARGIDARAVKLPGPASSVSVEETFERDVTSVDELRAIALRQADEVALRLDGEGRGARAVTVKVRYPDFRIATRSQSASAPFRGPDEIGRLALIALDRALADGPPPVRLLGIGVHRLVPAEQLRLFD
jgi:DNA polymerase-4